jgi:hypothetical protein
LVVTLVATAIAVPQSMQPVRAAATDVVISELMYHSADGPAGDDQLYDFVELTNTATTAIDLTGWQLTDGVAFTFPAFSLGSDARVIVANNAVAFEERYGVAPDFVLSSGSFSNSGETIRLVDASATTIDALAYTDDPPWPGVADGGGPSLERLDLGLPNAGDDTDAPNWPASLVPAGTPGEVNSVASLLGGPRIIAVDDGAARPAPGTAIVVSATVAGATVVTLEYRVMFGGPVTVAMLDDDASAGGAGDGVYSARIPAQARRTLVRYRVIANGVSAQATSPAASSAATLHGFVVADPTEPSDLPAFDFFMLPADYSLMLAKHRYDDRKFPITVALGDQVVTDALVRVRGGVSRRFPKPSLKIELPNGSEMTFPGVAATVDEFNLYRNPDPMPDVGWDIAGAAGLHEVEFEPMRSYLNGAYWGTGAYLTATDGRFRDANGIGDAAVYKQELKMQTTSTPAGQMIRWEKDEGADGDYTDIWQFVKTINAPASPTRSDYLWQQMDVPAMVNYMAFQAFTRHWDSTIKNLFAIRDPETTGRWSMQTWDLDAIFQPASIKAVSGELLPPRNHPVTRAMLDDPQILQMFGRRLQSLIAEQPRDALLASYDAKYARTGPAWNDDFAKWKWGTSPTRTRLNWIKGVNERFTLFARNTGTGKLIPPPASGQRTVVVSEIQYRPTGDGPEFIELLNTGTESIDLTGWTLEPVGYTLPAGTVLLGGQRLVVSSDDIALRATTTRVYAAGEYTGALSDSGATVRLADRSGTVVDEVSYTSSSPWPWPAGRTGQSLQVVDPSADNSAATNWGVSAAAGGSPGTAGTTVTDFGPPPSAGLVLNEYNAVRSDRLLESGGTDLTFGAVAGNGGDWFEMVTVGSDDLRGWTIDWADVAAAGTIRLSDDPLWATLRAGSIVTFSEDQPDDLSYDPASGDWSINLQVTVGGTSPYVSTDAALEVSHDDWRVTVRDRTASPRFGPLGEGTATPSGVNSQEVAAYQLDPSRTPDPAGYDDRTVSSFGLPNVTASGVQDFTSLR